MRLDFRILTLTALAFCGCENIPPGRIFPTRPIPVLTEQPSRPSEVSFPGDSGTMSIPVRFEFPEKESQCTVTGIDLIGDSVSKAVFAGGAIIDRIARRAVAANFHIPLPEEDPVADVKMKLMRATTRVSGKTTDSDVALKFEIVKSGGGACCYSKTFASSKTGIWAESEFVPASFYAAVGDAVLQFAKDFASNRLASVLLGWENPGIDPPALEEIEWCKWRDAWNGRVVVRCNGYEGFQARNWAVAQIAAASRSKLGGIEIERVRVIYTGENFDLAAKKWRLEFCAFARKPIALSFDKSSRKGVVAGDLELMKMDIERASKELKRFVKKEMDSRDGVVTNNSPSGDAELRFDDFETDKTFNLITHKFRLL